MEITGKLSALDKSNLYSAKSRAAKILKNDFLVSEFSTQYKLPDILSINLLVKKPVYAILSQPSNTFFLIDKSGLILYSASQSSLPFLVTGGSAYRIGDKVSESQLYELKLVQGIYLMYQVKSGVEEGQELLVDLPAGIRVIFSVEPGDTQVLLGGLRLVYTKITSDYPGVYKEIDMRYKNPVLRQ